MENDNNLANTEPVVGDPEVLKDDESVPTPGPTDTVSPKGNTPPVKDDNDKPEKDVVKPLDKTGDIPAVVVIDLGNGQVNPNTPRSVEAATLVNHATQTLQAVPDTIRHP